MLAKREISRNFVLSTALCRFGKKTWIIRKGKFVKLEKILKKKKVLNLKTGKSLGEAKTQYFQTAISEVLIQIIDF